MTFQPRRYSISLSPGTPILILLLSAWLPGPGAAEDAPLVRTGVCPPELVSFDRLLTSFVTERKVPGAALAVVKDGRLVLARGYGWADRERREPVLPTSRFRIASLSKPFTAAAMLQLVERGKLTLDARIADVLQLAPREDAVRSMDPRWREVTILRLLQHTGGFDRGVSFDPMFRSPEIVRTLGVKPPARPADIIRYMTDRPLDFDPGSRYAYSNFGYCLLGRAIEKVSGLSYERYVKEHVLGPLGVRDARLGKTLPAGRAPGEVVYYHYRGGRGRSVFDVTGSQVPRPYGVWCLEAMDAHGGWIASAVDLVRFAAAFDRPAACKVLRGDSIARMFARPTDPVWREKDGTPGPAYYACGWMVRPRPGSDGTVRRSTWHSGSLSGTSTLLVRRHDGLDWAVLFNTRNGPDGKPLAAAIDPLLHQAAAAVARWPEGDAFGEY